MCSGNFLSIKSAVYLRKKALCLCYTPHILSKEPCYPAKEPYYPAKEPYISAK